MFPKPLTHQDMYAMIPQLLDMLPYNGFVGGGVRAAKRIKRGVQRIGWPVLLTVSKALFYFRVPMRQHCMVPVLPAQIGGRLAVPQVVERVYREFRIEAGRGSQDERRHSCGDQQRQNRARGGVHADGAAARQARSSLMLIT